jgi:hypothetical protein
MNIWNKTEYINNAENDADKIMVTFFSSEKGI